MNDNQFNTNIYAQNLDYQDPETSFLNNASCAKHLENNGIAVGGMSKDRMKVMAQMMPTYTFDPENKTTKPESACTLPSHSSITFNNPSGSCIMQNVKNVTLHMADGKGPNNVVKGCVMKTNPNDVTFKDGQAFSSENEVNSFLDNAYEVLDADTRQYIQALRDRVQKLTIERNQLRDVDYPRAFSEHMTESQRYAQLVEDCKFQKKTYENLIQTQPAYIRQRISETAWYKDNADVVKNWLPGYYKYLVGSYYNRNINELSFVTLFQHVGYSGSKYVVSTNGRNHSATRGMGWFNDKASSAYIPPGMNVALYKHTRYRGSVRYLDSNSSSDHRENFRYIGFNDKASSAIVHGSFRSSVGYDPRGFEKRVNSIA